MRRVLRIFPFFIVFFILLCCGNVRVDPELPDQSNPAVVGVIPVSLSEAEVGNVSVTLTFSEAMDAWVNPAPTLSGLGSSPYTISGSSWANGNTEWTGTFVLIDDNEEVTGFYDISGFVDEEGNVMMADSNHTVGVDTLNPTLTVVSIFSDNADSALANAGDTVTIAITASESLGSLPTVTIDGNAVDSVVSTGENSYEARRVMQAGDTEGIIGFTIDFVDAAGNVGAQVTATTDLSSVVFTIPIMYVHPLSLEFYYNVEELTFSIENIGSGILNWQINPDVTWIECIDQQGDPVYEGYTTSEIDPITVRVNREVKGLAEINYGTVFLSWNKGQEEVEVTMYFQIGRKIYGTVTDAANGNPIEDAQVWLEPKDDYLTETDWNGDYEINNAPYNGITIYASKDGFLQYTSPKIPAGTDEELVNIEMQIDN